MGKAAEDHERYSTLADELGLEDDERDDFVTSAMKRLGHVAKTVWDDAPPKDGKGNGDGDFFSARRRQQSESGGGSSRETRRVGGDREYRG